MHHHPPALEYDIQSVEDIQDTIKDLPSGTIKEMMVAKMDEYLGCEKSERSDNEDYRNGYKHKRANSRYGSMEIEVPQEYLALILQLTYRISLVFYLL